MIRPIRSRVVKVCIILQFLACASLFIGGLARILGMMSGVIAGPPDPVKAAGFTLVMLMSWDLVRDYLRE
jgi:ABC-type iron transport system FetAB permease component